MCVTEKICEAVVRIKAGPATLEANMSVPRTADFDRHKRHVQHREYTL